ncbi:MAG: hypothetical protein KDA27_19765 [Candidatus Eisenbacteria bacterium]|uniref:Uncharacterized protein n=1 Tax=Eiseniibacteriota bacterium TaxID=2212470 RepID=A0A956NJ05_UNCEI|nr:hypothetical protein [Candidatus Eisenbacteria bacterium]MCB9465426.1 hypothetical protein [Candidatus Eisenbacteria bacterium]
MEGACFVHRSHAYDLEIPSAGPRFASAGLLICYALAAAALAAVGWSGTAPTWVSASPLPTGIRWVLLALGGIHALHGVVLASEQIQRGWALLGQKAGAFAVLESAGPCRLIQCGEEWDLHLALTQAPIWSELDEGREREGLYFRLDESDVAKIARLFDPGEEVAIRWLDLPDSLGGPTLLGLRTALREELLYPDESAEFTADSHEGLERAA